MKIGITSVGEARVPEPDKSTCQYPRVEKYGPGCSQMSPQEILENIGPEAVLKARKLFMLAELDMVVREITHLQLDHADDELTGNLEHGIALLHSQFGFAANRYNHKMQDERAGKEHHPMDRQQREELLDEHDNPVGPTATGPQPEAKEKAE